MSCMRSSRRLASCLASSTVLTALFGIAAADAQPLNIAPAAPARYAAAQGNLGGGFFEFLATGGTASPSRRGYASTGYSPDPGYGASDSRYDRQVVDYRGTEKPGTVIINTPEKLLYLGSSLYRIHGSNEPWTIGTQVSSGCIRMRNEDVIDLYNRVPVGAKVVVL